MDTNEFRSHAHELVDWMADYLETVGSRRVVPDVKPGDVCESPDEPPIQGEPFEAIFEDFRTQIVPGMTHWNHPGWFAYFPGNTSPPSILAEMLIPTLSAQCMSWQTSPAATELEQVVMEWLTKMLGIPDGFTGSIMDTASTATLVSLLTAREKATGGKFGTEGGGPERFCVYSSTEVHSSIDKAVKLAGLGLSNLRKLPVDENFALIPEELEKAIAEDRRNGLVPLAVVAAVGTTSSTAVDPLRVIGEMCKSHEVWLHVDAAYAGTAALLDEMRWIFDGAEYADSIVVNPHKWMLTNLHLTAYWVKDVEALLSTMSTSPEYLRTAHDAEAVNFRDWGIPLGRRFRALKLWFVIRSYGVEGLREIVRNHIALAQKFRGWVEAEPDFEILAPSPFGLVCFRFKPESRDLSQSELNSLNESILKRVNEDGRVHLTHTVLRGTYTIRLVVGQRTTDESHVGLAWEIVRQAARDE